MMTEGEAEIDMASLDPKRYGDVDDDSEYAARKNEECYEHVYHPAPPGRRARSLPAACGPRPVYDRHEGRSARSSAR